MEIYIPIMIGLLVTVIVIGIKSAQISTQNRNFKEAAEKLDLNFFNGGLLTSPSINGQIGDFQVEITHSSGGKYRAAFDSYNIYYSIPGNFTFSITKEKLLNKIFSEQDIHTGDKIFDDLFYLESNHRNSLVAMLNMDTRNIIRQLWSESDEHEFAVNERGIVMTTTNTNIEQIVEHLIRLSKLITRSGSVVEFHSENFKRDYNDAVRITNLELLLQYHKSFKGREEILQLAQKDRDPVVNFLAFQEGGIPNGEHYFKSLWQKAAEELKVRILKFITPEKHSASQEFLRSRFVHESLSIKLLLIETFGRFADPALSPFLVEQLSSGDNKIVTYAIKALASCGDIYAVEPLLMIKNPLLKAETKRSIAAIQSRLKTGDSGWLSLYESKSGELSLSNEGGNLSIKPPKQSPKKP